MPIINGTYAPDTLTTPKAAQQQVFGEYTRKDMSDYSTAAYNYLMKQQEQAYNLELWNLTNQYNTPAAMMQRYQDAGLNPNLVYQQQNAASAPSSASAPSFRSGGTMAKSMQNGLSVIQQILGMTKAARETYDYLKFGRGISANGLLSAQESAYGQHLQNEWNQLLLEGPSEDIDSRSYLLSQGPRYRMYQLEAQDRGERIKQIGAIIKHYAKTDERFDKLMELDDQRLGQMQAQYGFIMNGFHSGNETLDSFLRLLLMFGLQSGL